MQTPSWPDHFLPEPKSRPEKPLFTTDEFKSYRGMGSVEAMQQGSKDRYFQDVEDDVNLSWFPKVLLRAIQGNP